MAAGTLGAAPIATAAFIFNFCFSAHSRLACLPLSAASSLAFFAAASFSLRILSRSVFSLLSRSKTSLPLQRCCAASAAVTVDFTEAGPVWAVVEGLRDIAELETDETRVADMLAGYGRFVAGSC